MKTTLVTLAVLFLAHATSAQELDLRAQIDPLAQPLVDEGVAVGLVVGIYRGGQTQVIPYGETEKGSGTAPTGDTLYEIGSVTKVFTGTLLADLVNRRRVKLDDPIQKYLPEKAKADIKNPTGITFEHLATHTSGLPRLSDNMKMADPLNPYADYTFKEVFAFLKNHQPAREPGDHEYSNYGMGLLGVLLASREKLTYEQLIVGRIAKPLDMSDTRITLTDEQSARLAPPYDAALEPAKTWDVPALAGCGAIRSTTNDMLKFVAANLADDDKPITKTLALAREKRAPIPDGAAIGLAWHIHPDGVTRWHNGMTGGYAAWLAVVPDYDVGVVVLANTATTKITDLGLKLTGVALGQDIKPDAPRATVEVAPEVLKKYEGVYEITPQFALTVTVEGDKLMVQATDQQKFQVFPETETQFFYKVVDARLFFVADDRGNVNHLVLHQNGANQIAKRRNARGKGAPAPIEEGVKVARDVLKKYVGAYAITPEFVMTVTLNGDQLAVQATGQQKLRLTAESETKFSVVGVDAQVTFAGEKDGKAEMLILHQNGANQVATRQD